MAKTVIKVIDMVPGKVEPLITILSKDLKEADFRANFLDKHQPVIIKGAASHWPAIKKWLNYSYLSSITGDQEVKASSTFNIMPDYLLPKVQTPKKLKEAIAEMRSLPDDETYSLTGMPVPVEWQKDLGDYPFLKQKFAKPKVYPDKILFLYKNASTEWHQHPIDETSHPECE